VSESAAPAVAIEVDILIEDERWGVDDTWRAPIERCVAVALADADVDLPPAVEVSVVLSDDGRVRTLNRDYRGEDKPTNVLSFPGSDDLDSPMLGDVVLAYETCRREAEGDDKPFQHHIHHLVVHGVLHLIGYDHMTTDEAVEMEALETRILAALGVPDPYAGSEPVSAGAT
jgi:probable rRNA maturation factor